MHNRTFLAVMSVLTMLSISGCWDSRDIEDMAFPLAAAYDLHQENGRAMETNSMENQVKLVDVTTLIPVFATEAPSHSKLETISSSSIAYVRNDRTFSNANEYNTGLNSVLVFGEDLARNGMHQYVDTLDRVPVISHFMRFAVAEGRGEDILKAPAIETANMGDYLDRLLRCEGKSFMPCATLHDFDDHLARGKNPVLPLIGKGSSNQVSLIGSAVFRKDFLVGKLNVTDTRSLVMLRGHKTEGYLPFLLNNGENEPARGTVHVANKRSVKVSRQGNDINFMISVMLEGTLDEYTASSIMDEKILQAIEDAIEHDQLKECEGFIKKMQEDLKVDCIDISKYAMAKWRNELNPVIDGSDFIQKVQIQVEVKVHIINTGEKK